jgi:hypothetical protein
MEILLRKIQLSFLAQFLRASLLAVSAETREENCGRWIGSD